jgi:hypothetical protein
MTTVTSAGSQPVSAVVPTLQDLMAQKIIGPGMFYWRYTLSVEERILGVCLCSPSTLVHL